MLTTTVELIKNLRSQTGAGVMECRKALEQSRQDYAAALAHLQEAAARKAQKQAANAALEGTIEVYSHSSGRIGVMVEINTQTEFASRSPVFRQFAHEIALQITAAVPLYVRDEDIPLALLDEQAQAAAEKARLAGKRAAVVAEIVAGVLEKYRSRVVLLRQPYLRDETLTVAQLQSQASAQLGENIVIRRFLRWEINPDAPGE